MKVLGLVLLGLSLALLESAAAQEKTDLAREIYVEKSATDFTLEGKAGQSRSRNVRVFDLSSPNRGSHTLLCFINGKVWSQQKLDLPGQFKLNTAGMSKGSHRLTLQAVDVSGRVGSITLTVKVE